MECNIEAYKLQCRNKGKGKSFTARMEWSATALAVAPPFTSKGGGFRRRTSSRHNCNSAVRDGLSLLLVWLLMEDQPIIASQRASLSSRPREDRKA